ncbi:hypothetical protein CCH79_00012862 [Gambusia affinis]|uniref:Uncharacterized protein n=1 Tax=Gambusia affinis TaxID=33528 RepID=A0A315VYY0_GAMAF|nr:hypothetical protein CCH79_00012862 [Gambusia affinis]
MLEVSEKTEGYEAPGPLLTSPLPLHCLVTTWMCHCFYHFLTFMPAEAQREHLCGAKPMKRYRIHFCPPAFPPAPPQLHSKQQDLLIPDGWRHFPQPGPRATWRPHLHGTDLKPLDV